MILGIETLIDAIKRAENGLINTDLGSAVIKQRIARNGQGRSKGFRTIIIFRPKVKAFFIYGFAKKDRDNLRLDEEDSFKEMSEHLLSLSENTLDQLLINGDFREVEDND